MTKANSCKLCKKKDRKKVKYSRNLLKDRRFCVVEQLPREIEERGKRLYPVIRKAKENKHLK
jgi:hypothetical protein